MLVKLEQVVDREFDYVVVGGGTSGLCLAARLTEDANTSVLVLEAGAANLNDPNILRPASYGSHFGKPDYDWCFSTTPQKHCGGTQFPWQRGKGLGGSSGINFMCWTKPPKEEIDDIERLGNPGWNWKNYQRYSTGIEKFERPSEDVQAKHQLELAGWEGGVGGTLMTAFPKTIPRAEVDVQQTLVNLGLPVAPSPLGGNPTGVFFTPNTLDPTTHTRSYATTAFYLPNAHRENFEVLVEARVGRVVTEKIGVGKGLGGGASVAERLGSSAARLDGGGNGEEGLVKATGVEFECEGRKCVVRVKREVLLCAGALKSPQILELSGIGRKDAVESVGVESVVEVDGVGENVQEHVFAGVVYELKDDATFEHETLDMLRDPKVAAEHVELHATGAGLYTLGIVGFAFAPLSALAPDAAKRIYADVKAKIGREERYGRPGVKEMVELQLERLERGAPSCEIISFPGFLGFPCPPKPGKKYVSILVAVNHQWSRGTIHCTSIDPQVDPAFDPHYFEEEIDLEQFVESVKFVREKMRNTAPFKDIVIEEVNPGPEVRTDEEIGDWLKKYMMTTYHTVGSCSMLPREKGGVVDPNLKVYGTSNVRVVDISVVPLHFASHTQATSYAIAEQAADIIKGRFPTAF